MAEKYVFSMVMGDIYNKSHGRVWRCSVSSNKQFDEIKRAYDYGCKQIGFDVNKKVGTKSFIPLEVLNTLAQKGIHISKLDDEYDMNVSPKGYWLYNQEVWVKLYFSIATIFDTTIEYTIRDSQSDKDIYIGGINLV